MAVFRWQTMMRKNRRNHYRVLQVQPDAPIEVIKASYRTLMRTLKYHPDLGGDEWQAALVNEAYEVLTDTRKREAYDRERSGLATHVGSTARLASAHGLATPVPAGRFLPEPVDARICAFCNTKNGRSAQSVDEVCSGCDAPLWPVDLTAPELTERAARRIEHHADIYYRVDSWKTGPTPARMSDLSPTGLRFVSGQRLIPGWVVKIDSPTLSAVAKVTRSEAYDPLGLFSTGVRLLTLKLARPTGTFVSLQA
jgi:hypothetical protein